VTDTVGGSEPDPDFDAAFAKLLRDIEAGRPARVHEPSARARMLREKWVEQAPPTTPWRGEAPTFGDATVEANQTRKDRYRRAYAVGRVWPRKAAIAVIVCALAFAVVETDRDRSKTAAVNAPPPTATARATTGPSTLAADEMIPLTRLFPETVPAAHGGAYTLLQSGRLADCIKSDLVGPKLAGLFAQSDGCVGGEEALYQDAANDQFNVIVFTLEDAGDALRIRNDLSMDSSEFEVAPQVPPARSGLPDLSGTDGRVQLFASAGNQLGVFMAQWADGHASGYGDLENLLTPLQDTVVATLSDARGSR